MRRPDAAIKAFRDLLSTWPDDKLAPGATLALSRTLIDVKRPAEAIPLLADFGTKYPNSPQRPDAQYLLGLAKLRGGDAKNGINDLKAFLEANPRHELAGSARRLVNDTAARTGDKDDLQATYQARLAESPATAEGLYEAASIAGRLGRAKDQEALWRRIRTTFPEHAMGRRASLDLAKCARDVIGDRRGLGSDLEAGDAPVAQTLVEPLAGDRADQHRPVVLAVDPRPELVGEPRLQQE